MHRLNVCIVGLCLLSIILAMKQTYDKGEQQRQIDQVCKMVFTLAREQGATDETGFTGGKEYCFFFADYNRNMAILGEFDRGIRYDKKPRLIIMHNIDEGNLEYWDKLPVIYDRYKKIPN